MPTRVSSSDLLYCVEVCSSLNGGYDRNECVERIFGLQATKVRDSQLAVDGVAGAQRTLMRSLQISRNFCAWPFFF